MILSLIIVISVFFFLMQKQIGPIVICLLTYLACYYTMKKHCKMFAFLTMWTYYAMNYNKESFATLEDIQQEIAEMRELNKVTYEQTQNTLNQVLKQQLFLGKQLVD
jgi:hypothetical protein